MKRSTLWRLAFLPALAACTGNTAPAGLLTGTPVVIEGAFLNDSGEVSVDLSGATCAATARAGEYSCAFVDDESTTVQFATFVGGRLRVGTRTPLLGVGAPGVVSGAPPGAPRCPKGVAAFKDLDAEAVTLTASHVYVVGSHGCGRNSERFRPSSFLLARKASAGAAQAEYSYRISEMLLTDPVVGAYFTQSLNDANGLNIEGMTVHEGRLLVGLRAPSLKGKAYILSAPISELFAATPNAALSSKRIELDLGEHVGIRDLATAPDGRLLVLTGPSQEQDGPYAVVGVRDDGRVDWRAELAPIVGIDGDVAKAEGLATLGSVSGRLRVMIAYDGAENGGLRTYGVQMR